MSYIMREGSNLKAFLRVRRSPEVITFIDCFAITTTESIIQSKNLNAASCIHILFFVTYTHPSIVAERDFLATLVITAKLQTNTTNGQKFATPQHLDMSRCWALALRCGKFVVELLWACPLVVSLAGVRVVEFGSNEVEVGQKIHLIGAACSQRTCRGGRKERRRRPPADRAGTRRHTTPRLRPPCRLLTVVPHRRPSAASSGSGVRSLLIHPTSMTSRYSPRWLEELATSWRLDPRLRRASLLLAETPKITTYPHWQFDIDYCTRRSSSSKSGNVKAFSRCEDLCLVCMFESKTKQMNKILTPYN